MHTIMRCTGKVASRVVNNFIMGVLWDLMWLMLGAAICQIYLYSNHLPALPIPPSYYIVHSAFLRLRLLPSPY